jgi:hypothetical protein
MFQREVWAPTENKDRQTHINMSNADDKESKNPRDQMKRKHSVDLSEDRKPSKKHVAPTFINLTSHGPAFNSHPVPLK